MSSEFHDLYVKATIQMAGEEMLPATWRGSSPMRLAFTGEGFSAESIIHFEEGISEVLPNQTYSVKIRIAFGERLKNLIVPGLSIRMLAGAREYAKGTIDSLL